MSVFAQRLTASITKTPLVPGLLMVVIVFGLTSWGSVPEHWLTAVTIAARTLFVVGAAIAVRFGRARAAVVLGILSLSFEVVVVGSPLGGATVSKAAGELLLAWVLPIWLFVSSLAPPRAAGSGATVIRLVAALLLAGAGLYFLAPFAGDWAAWAKEPLVLGAPNPAGGQLSAALFIIAMIGLAVRLLRFRSAMDAGLMAATAAAWMGVASPLGPTTSALYLAAGAAALGLAVVETGYGLAYRDALTTLPSRRALNEELAALRGPYALAMVDVDHFKKFNDKHGHDVGDQVLRMVAAVLAQTGGRARAFRYGGEEFTLLFAGRTPEQALEHVEQTRGALAAARLTIRGPQRPKKVARKTAKAARTKNARSGPQVSVTASFGLAAGHGRRDRADTVLKRADKALYKAKKAGRNRVLLG